MKKLLLTGAALALFAAAVHAQSPYISQNFNGTTGTSLPSGWTQTGSGWKTGNASSLNSAYFGSPDLDGRMLMINDDKDNTDYSDQMIKTSAFSLSSATNAYAKFNLTYLAASGTGVAEELTLEASTDGGTTWTVVRTFAATATYWEPTYVDLTDYEGESSVILGFRYKDDGEWMYGAAIENFSVIDAPTTELGLTSVAPVEGSSVSYGLSGDDKTISGTVFNGGSSAISSYVVKYQQGTGPVQNFTVSGSLPAFTSGTFTHGTDFAIPSTGEFPIDVWVEVAGDADATNNEGSTVITGVSSFPTKRLVIEEGTGTWCGWCPRGTVAMDEFAIEHPNVAAQVAVHNGDPMTIEPYNTAFGAYISGYPSLVIDRSFGGDPGDIATMYESYKDNFGFADMTVGTVSVSGSTATVPVTINPAVSIENAKLALIVTESNITGPVDDEDWSQHNYYSEAVSGGELGAMGGFENLPEYVPGTRFHFVARAITPSPTGGTTGVPATMTPGTPVTVNLTVTLGSSWNQDNLQYIAVLVNEDNQFMNSAFTALPTLGAVLSAKNVSLDVNKLELYPNPASNFVKLNVDLKESSDVSVVITDITGKVVINQPYGKMTPGVSTFEIATSGLSNGMYMLSLNTAKGKTAMKFVVAR